jgi:hypothetical protein
MGCSQNQMGSQTMIVSHGLIHKKSSFQESGNCAAFTLMVLTLVAEKSDPRFELFSVQFRFRD